MGTNKKLEFEGSGLGVEGSVDYFPYVEVICVCRKKLSRVGFGII